MTTYRHGKEKRNLLIKGGLLFLDGMIDTLSKGKDERHRTLTINEMRTLRRKVEDEMYES